MNNIQEYQEAAVRTFESKGYELDIAAMTLGVAGEVGEFVELLNEDSSIGDIKKEAGDVLWYLATISHIVPDLSLESVLQADEFDEIEEWICREFPFDMPNIPGVLSGTIRELNCDTAKLCDMVKKHVHQGHSLDMYELEEAMRGVFITLAYTCLFYGISLKDVAQKNIDKLMKRYPDGFSPEASINRTC